MVIVSLHNLIIIILYCYLGERQSPLYTLSIYVTAQRGKAVTDLSRTWRGGRVWAARPGRPAPSSPTTRTHPCSQNPASASQPEKRIIRVHEKYTFYPTVVSDEMANACVCVCVIITGELLRRYTLKNRSIFLIEIIHHHDTTR